MKTFATVLFVIVGLVSFSQLGYKNVYSTQITGNITEEKLDVIVEIAYSYLIELRSGLYSFSQYDGITEENILSSAQMDEAEYSLYYILDKKRFKRQQIICIIVGSERIYLGIFKKPRSLISPKVDAKDRFRRTTEEDNF